MAQFRALASKNVGANAPTLEIALQQQLGLRFATIKGTVFKCSLLSLS